MIKLTIEGSNWEEVMIRLAEALTQTSTTKAPEAAAPVTPASVVPPVAPMPAVPVTPMPTVPVTAVAPAYTLDQLAVAAGRLMDAGKRTQLVAILQGLGATALTDLAPDKYGAFATAIRQEGAQI